VGGVLVVGASGVLAYLLTRPTTVPIQQADTSASPFITIDAQKEITIGASDSRSQILSKLTAAKEATSLSLGLVSQLVITQSSTTANGDVTIPLKSYDFLPLIAPHAPPDFVRSLKQAYMLGVHVYDGNQPFLILSVYSYEQAYSGMLAWEPYLKSDLAPLFNYLPHNHGTTATDATTTADSTTQFIQSGFVDKIILNHDSRALVDNNGNIYLLWTFIDSNTLIITTNESTLREVISRLKVAPIIPIPGQ
jgi:hypothetical protein